MPVKCADRLIIRVRGHIPNPDFAIEGPSGNEEPCRVDRERGEDNFFCF